MDILVISTEKIKLTLSCADMEKYNLNSESMDYNMSQTREAIKEILDEVKVRTGIEFDGKRVFIQAYPCRSGGCELYITQLVTKNLPAVPDCGQSDIYISAVFDNLPAISAFCNRLCSIKGIHSDCVYYDNYRCNYILTFKSSTDIWENDAILNAIVREFGGITVNGKENSFSSATERYTCLATVDAIGLFADLKSLAN